MGAWIETGNEVFDDASSRSHPTWVRGLKLLMLIRLIRRHLVAPYMGAWIETSMLIRLMP